MAIYKKGYYDLYMYQGDTGNIKIKGIPNTGNYYIYLDIMDQSGVSILPEPLCEECFYKNEVVFPIGTDISDNLPVGTHYYAVKLCYENELGMVTEETVIPPLKNTILTPTNFKNKATFSVYPKQIEGA